MRLGILGGTFDPIHYAHLFIAEEARVRLSLDRVIFVPNGTPPHKHPVALSSAAHRLAMTKLGIGGNPGFACSPIEVDRRGPSYTVDTLLELKRDEPEADLLFIAGYDSLAEVPTWRRYREILDLARFVAVTRAGFDTVAALDALARDLREKVDVIAAPPLDISSTLIRDRVRAGLPIRYLTPDPVVEYIGSHRLY